MSQLTGKFRIGTSGYSFPDWVGPFYPPGTKSAGMFEYYATQFGAVELNYTYYTMPVAKTLESLVSRSLPGFIFWVKANQATTHRQDRSIAGRFIDALGPLRQSGRLGGVLMQFPQSFHRTRTNRLYLQAAADDFAGMPLAVEFRHASWDHPSVVQGLAERQVSLVIPDAPAIEGLFRPRPALAGPVAYFRLHSRNAALWYAGAADRYDYNYSDAELAELYDASIRLAENASCVCVFFNNCKHGQAAKNASRFARMARS